MDVKSAGAKGGKARAANMTAKERTMASSHAALALWRKIRNGELGKDRRRARRKAGQK